MVATEGAPSWQRALELAALAVVPVPLLTALLYYFGYVRTQVVCDYFGISISRLGLSSQDYVVRSSRLVFDRLVVLAVLALVGIVVHLLMTRGLHKLSPQSRWCRAAAPAVAVGSALSFLAALDGFGRLPGSPWWFTREEVAVPLGLGAILAEYAVHLAEGQRLRRWRQRRRRRRGEPPSPLMSSGGTLARRALLGSVVLIAVFWGFAVQAASEGAKVTYAVASDVPHQPEAIVYTKERLQLDGYGINVTSLPLGESDWRFRYTGLHVLFYSEGRWFLLPADWRRDNGAPVVVLDDNPATYRVDTRPRSLA
ncbi:hypothetical protein CcI49_29305 [Frankia sp. CcI49]|uniref:hypothetical protein n=1 Tax=unclassified Frankia TaxID=2632575 RepID=UPI0006C9FA9A|nr:MULTISPECIES: hypothetical protein [unclassified Frankia]KPM53470.1 hypothetical protein ACG83_22535 [Frankia sp. R43]ONH54810.1 hypothetical protein CcI49_29305 [Frankia sp. CcI49]